MSGLEVRTLIDLLSLRKPDNLYYLKPQILAYGGSLFIYGKAGTWKSTLAIDLCMAIAQGKKWLIYDTSKAKTLTFQSEQVEIMYADRVQNISRKRLINGVAPGDISSDMLYVTAQDLKLDDFRGQSAFEDVLKKHTPQVCVIDCMYRSLKSTRDEQSAKQFLDFLSLMQTRYGIAFIIIHHPRKSYGDDDMGFDEMTGSAIFSYWADSILRVSPNGPMVDGSYPNLDLTWEKLKNCSEVVPNVKLRVDKSNLRFIVR